MFAVHPAAPALQGNPLMRSTFLMNDEVAATNTSSQQRGGIGGSGWRLPRIGELCCQQLALARTLDGVGGRLRGHAHICKPDYRIGTFQLLHQIEYRKCKLRKMAGAVAQHAQSTCQAGERGVLLFVRTAWQV